MTIIIISVLFQATISTYVTIDPALCGTIYNTPSFAKNIIFENLPSENDTINVDEYKHAVYQSFSCAIRDRNPIKIPSGFFEMNIRVDIISDHMVFTKDRELILERGYTTYDRLAFYAGHESTKELAMVIAREWLNSNHDNNAFVLLQKMVEIYYMSDWSFLSVITGITKFHIIDDVITYGFVCKYSGDDGYNHLRTFENLARAMVNVEQYFMVKDYCDTYQVKSIYKLTVCGFTIEEILKMKVNYNEYDVREFGTNEKGQILLTRRAREFYFPNIIFIDCSEDALKEFGYI